MTRSQTYRAPCWTAAKWLCLSLWGNSLLSLMLTVVVGYWGLAPLLGLGGKRSSAGNGLGLGAELRMCLGCRAEMLMEMRLHFYQFTNDSDDSRMYMRADWGLHVCTHVSNAHPHAGSAWQRAGKSLLELVSRSWPAVFVPAVLVNSFSILTEARQQQRRIKLWDIAKHLISSCSFRGRGILWHTLI